MIGVRKWGRAVVAMVLSVALMGAYVPKEGMITYGSEIEKRQIVYYGIPEEETTMIEVFNEDGSMDKVSMGIDEYEKENNDVPAMEIKSDTKKMNQSKTMRSISPAPSVGAYNFAYEDLVNNGSDTENYCILIAGDGYTAGEQEKFLQVAQNIANHFMSQSPFNEPDIRNKINIRAVCVISNQSGVSLDPENPYDTFFKTTFNNNGIERLIWAHNSDSVWEIVNQYMPDCQVPIIVGNSTQYGGSGGKYCTISANEKSSDIAIHEFGHTGGELADEYWEITTDESNRKEAPNRTAVGDPVKCKWSDLMGIKGVGLYEYSEAPGWYRPHQSCKMRTSTQEFCEVCKRQIRYKIKSIVDNPVYDNEIIYNAEQLQSYANRVAMGASTTGKTVTLANDITLSGTNNISVLKEFNGTFNGNGHIIRGIDINSSESRIGLIGELGSNGTVLNLGIESANIVGDNYYCGGIVGDNNGTIYGCSFSGYVEGTNGTGGIAGNNVGIIHNCYNVGTVYSSSQVAGGIVGWMRNGTMYNCFNYGKISVGSSWYGGVCGYNPGGTISSCYYLEGTAPEGVAGQGSTAATRKRAEEFTNGLLTAALNSVNSVWEQGESYPVLSYKSIPIQQETTTEINTQQPTTQKETEASGNEPIEVFGLMLTCNRNNTITVVWGQNEEQIAKGQKYNVYVDGNKKLEQVGCGQYEIESVAGGTHTVKVTAVLNGKETAGVLGEIAVTGSSQTEVTTQVPKEETSTEYTINESIEINGCQISATSQGVRTIYSVENKIKNKDVVESGMVYSIADYVGESELYVGSDSVYVQDFKSTQTGLCGENFSGSKTASSYAMTVKFSAKTMEEYKANWRVKAYAKLSDGSYVYTEAIEYSIYNIADILYQGNNMTTESTHNFLYDDILKIVNNNYAKIDFDHSKLLVK